MACLQKRMQYDLAGLNSMLLVSANIVQMSSVWRRAHNDEASKMMSAAYATHPQNIRPIKQPSLFRSRSTI